MPIQTEEDAKFLADMIRSGKLEGARKEQAFQDLAAFRATVQGGMAEPFQLPANKQPALINMKSGLTMRPAEEFTPQERQAAASGVDIMSGPTEGLRQTLAYGRNDSERFQYLKAQGLKPRMGPESGKIEYLDPETNRYVQMESAVGSPIPTVAGATQFTGEVGGAIGGGILGNMVAPIGGTIPIGAAGALAGGSVASAFNQKVAEVLGIRQEPVSGAEAFRKGTEAAAYDLTGAVGLGATRAVRSWFKGLNALSLKKMTELEGQLGETDRLVKEYNDLAGDPIDLRVSQRTRDPRALQLDEAAASDPDVKREMFVQLDSQLSSLQRTWKAVRSRFAPDSYAPRSGGEAAVAALRNKRDEAVRLANLQKIAKEEQLRRRVQGLPDMTPEEMGVWLKETIQPRWEASHAVTDKAWQDLRVTYGIPEHRSALSSPSDYYAPVESHIKLNTDEKFDLFLQNYVGEANRIPDKSLAAAKKAALPDELLKAVESGKPAAEVDLHGLMQYILALKSGVRKDFASNQGLKLDDKDAKVVADALESWVSRSLQKKSPEALSAWEVAKEATESEYRTFQHTLLGDFIKKSNKGQMPVLDYIAFIDAFKKNRGAASTELYNIIKNDPGALNEARNMLFGLFKNEYTDAQGNLVKDAVAKFKQDYEVPLRTFFGDARYKTIGSNIDSMVNEVHAANQAYKNVNSIWRAKFEGKWGRLNSVQIGQTLFGKNNTTRDVEELMVFLKTNAPEAIDGIKAETAYEFWRRTADPNGVPFWPKMQSELNRYGPSLKAVLGEQYVKDVKTLLSTARLVKDVPRVAEGSEIPLLYTLLRTVFRPLSREGLVQTFGRTSRVKAAPRAIQNALQNPEALRKLIATTEQRGRKYVVAGAAGAAVGTKDPFAVLDDLNAVSLMNEEE